MKLQSPVSVARRRLVDRLKRSGPTTSAALAHDLGLTEAAVRHTCWARRGATRRAQHPTAKGPGTTRDAVVAHGACDRVPSRSPRRPHGRAHRRDPRCRRRARPREGDRGVYRRATRRVHRRDAGRACDRAKARGSTRRGRTDEGYMAEVRVTGATSCSSSTTAPCVKRPPLARAVPRRARPFPRRPRLRCPVTASSTCSPVTRGVRTASRPSTRPPSHATPLGDRVSGACCSRSTSATPRPWSACTWPTTTD